MYRTPDSFANGKTFQDGKQPYCKRCGVLSLYGLSAIEYEIMLEEQGGVCKICRGVNKGGKELSVDHDHSCCPGYRTCGKCIRGLLCHNCNAALGHLRDDPNLMLRAIDYLKGNL
jgi:hypothetical protein